METIWTEDDQKVVDNAENRDPEKDLGEYRHLRHLHGKYHLYYGHDQILQESYYHVVRLGEEAYFFRGEKSDKAAVQRAMDYMESRLRNIRHVNDPELLFNLYEVWHTY